MRSMTTINWVRETLTTEDGFPLGTVHMGNRGSWSFQIRTARADRPQLMARCSDGRAVQQDHVSLKAAKNAALELLHPSERMGWSAVSAPGSILYRAQWDDLVFVVFRHVENLMFQWRDSVTGERSLSVQVSGIREAREMAAAVLRDAHPVETPAGAPQAADGAHTTLAAALEVAGIAFTLPQLTVAVSLLLDAGPDVWRS